jgi:hypothetical protein
MKKNETVRLHKYFIKAPKCRLNVHFQSNKRERALCVCGWEAKKGKLLNDMHEK